MKQPKLRCYVMIARNPKTGAILGASGWNNVRWNGGSLSWYNNSVALIVRKREKRKYELWSRLKGEKYYYSRRDNTKIDIKYWLDTGRREFNRLYTDSKDWIIEVHRVNSKNCPIDIQWDKFKRSFLDQNGKQIDIQNGRAYQAAFTVKGDHARN